MLYNIDKIKWSCRRGMLELDVLLGNFLHDQFASLDPKKQGYFVNLLSYSDVEIYAWIMGNDVPFDQELIEITGLIRSHARSRI